MLNKPPLVDMMKKVDSKYSLVIVAAKRARTIIDKNPEMLSSGAVNPLTMALEEVMNNQLHWTNSTSAQELPAEPSADAAAGE